MRTAVFSFIVGCASLGGCLSPFATNVRHTDKPIGNLVLRSWTWEREKICNTCCGGGPVIYGKGQFLDSSGRILVEDSGRYWRPNESSPWLITAVGHYAPQACVYVLNTAEGRIYGKVDLPAPPSVQFDPQFDRSGHRLLLSCSEGEDTSSVSLVEILATGVSTRVLYRAAKGRAAVSRSEDSGDARREGTGRLWSPDEASIALLVRVGLEAWDSATGWRYPKTELVKVPLERDAKPSTVDRTTKYWHDLKIEWDAECPSLGIRGRK